MPRDRLRQIEAVTDNFFFWQGLRWIPLGAALFLTATAMLPGSPLPRAVRNWFWVPLFAVAYWLSMSVLGRFYASRFGRVRSDPSRHRLRTSIKWAVVYPAIVVAMVVDAKVAPPILLSAVAFGAAIEAYRQSTGGGRLHYIVASIALVGFAFLPMLGMLDPGKRAFAPLIAALGLIYVVGGLLDHRELVRVLGDREEARVSSV